MPSFDTVLKADSVELRNAVDQSNKEITGRFDFKGSDARVEQKEFELTAFADSEFQLGQVLDILRNKCAKRNVDVRFLVEEDVQKNRRRQSQTNHQSQKWRGLGRREKNR